jgi:hypothetical protein
MAIGTVNRDRNPDLRLHRVLAGAVEGLALQVLLDPLEEEFDLLAALVDCGDSKCRGGCGSHTGHGGH